MLHVSILSLLLTMHSLRMRRCSELPLDPLQFDEVLHSDRGQKRFDDFRETKRKDTLHPSHHYTRFDHLLPTTACIAAVETPWPADEPSQLPVVVLELELALGPGLLFAAAAAVAVGSFHLSSAVVAVERIAHHQHTILPRRLPTW